MLNGFTPQRISAAYKREIGNLGTVSMMYGFNFSKEHVIRWFEPQSARCFTYDYVNQVFTEDNAWEHGEFTRLPIYAYAEIGGVPYVGDYNATGKIFRWGDDLYSDGDGNYIRLLRRLRVPLAQSQTNPYKKDRPGVKCRVNKLQLRFKRGSGGATTSTENLLVRWAFDEGAYTPYSNLAIGGDGDADPYVDVFDPNGAMTLGVGRELKLEIVQMENVPHLMTHALITAEPMGR